MINVASIIEIKIVKRQYNAITDIKEINLLILLLSFDILLINLNFPIIQLRYSIPIMQNISIPANKKIQNINPPDTINHPKLYNLK